MATPIEMPKPGVTVEECLLVRWHKGEGEVVAAGELIAEIETDKAAFEITAPVAGVLRAHFFEEGQLVPVYTNLCVIGEPGENVEAYRPAPAAAPAASPPAAAPSGRRPEPALEPASSGRGALSPRARRFAEERRYPAAGIAGSGPGGRVLEDDVKRAFYSRPRLAAEAPAPLPAPRPAGVRDRIARRMRESLAGTAQYTLHSSADAGALLRLRQAVKAARLAVDVNINEMVMYCAVQALQSMPELNAEFVDGQLRRHEHIHLGFACDTPRGLLVPVVRHAESLDLEALARRAKELTAQAVEGRISPDDLTGATFTVSNLGNLGIESFTPILNPPQVALLGVDSIEVRPVRRDGEIVFTDRIGLSLTADHQVIDGAPGARFLLVLRQAIEGLPCTI